MRLLFELFWLNLIVHFSCSCLYCCCLFYVRFQQIKMLPIWMKRLQQRFFCDRHKLKCFFFFELFRLLFCIYGPIQDVQMLFVMCFCWLLYTFVWTLVLRSIFDMKEAGCSFFFSLLNRHFIILLLQVVFLKLKTVQLVFRSVSMGK